MPVKSSSSSKTSSSRKTSSTSGSSSCQKRGKGGKGRYGGKGDSLCCGEGFPPYPAVYKPGFCCFERVQGPFKKLIPTPYDACIKKMCCKSKPPSQCCFEAPPPCPPYLRPRNLVRNCCDGPPTACCDAIRQNKACQSELIRLQQERWKEQQCKAILEEKRRREWLDEQYMCQVRQWEEAQIQCCIDQERRKKLLRQIKCQRKEVQRLRQEARDWRVCKKQMLEKHKQDQDKMWALEYQQKEDERRYNQERLRMCQEDKFLNAQMTPRDSENMKMPEMEDLRRMFAPVHRGPNETFEYYLVEPRPDTAEMRKSAQLKMAALLGLRDQHGIHLNLCDRAQKRTTIQLAMGPKLVGGERNQCCNVITQPGSYCCREKCGSPQQSMPNVPVPKMLRPLMQTLSYRVNKINSPLLRMEGYGPGPNFNGSRLYGTVVIPKGKILSPYYTDPYAVTF